MNFEDFFSKDKRRGELKLGTKNRRNLLITMLENNEMLSVKQLSSRSDMSYTDIRFYIDRFVKSKLVKSITTARYKARTDSKYELTDEGILLALAIKHDEKMVLGESVKLLSKLFQLQGKEPMPFFINSVMLNAINKKLEHYVLDIILYMVKKIDSKNGFNISNIAYSFVASAESSDFPKLKDAVLNALDSLDEAQKDVVIQFYKTSIATEMFNVGMAYNNSKMQRLAHKTSKAEDGIYIDLICTNRKCRKESHDQYIEIENLIISSFSGGIPCPKCKQIIRCMDQLPKKGFRNPKINS